MKKIAVILFVVSAALAGCHKSKPAAAKPAGGDMGSGAPAGSGDAGGGSGSAAAPAGGGGGN
jgi:hypothetical protein